MSIMDKLKKNSKLKVLHRIDGSAQDYGRRDDADKKQSQVNTLADVTIFQSNYGKYATMQKYPVIKNDGVVIYNPVDIDTFSPLGERVDFPYKIKICCATFSTNKKKGLSHVYRLAEQFEEFDFILCGRLDGAPDLRNIHLMGMLDNVELAKVMRSCDLFLFPSENEACPNVVLEAMASGLPVIYKDSGATSEIVGRCGIPMGEEFEADVQHIISNRPVLSAETRDRAIEGYSPDIIFELYIKAILNAERKPVKRYFDSTNRVDAWKVVVDKRLAWFKERADNPSFWEDSWSAKVNVPRELNKARRGCRSFHKKMFRKWIPKDLPVLEGGCGFGSVVMSLQSESYDVIGVDFSASTIQQSKRLAPDLNIEYGDIFKLDFPDNNFGAYISLGVVEHYWDGPEKAFNEAYRVIKPGGIFICSVPYFSPIRRLREYMGDYSSQEVLGKDKFYQYAFTNEEFSILLSSSGFSVVDRYCYASILGARKDLWGFERLYGLVPSTIRKVVTRIDLGKSIFGHMIAFVAIKK